jgi:hypothetical protein
MGSSDGDGEEYSEGSSSSKGSRCSSSSSEEEELSDDTEAAVWVAAGATKAAARTFDTLDACALAQRREATVLSLSSLLAVSEDEALLLLLHSRWRPADWIMESWFDVRAAPARRVRASGTAMQLLT